MRQQPAGLVDQDGVAAAADPHLVDGAPQLLEAQATHQVGDRRPGVIEAQRDLGRGELRRVDLDRGDVRPLRDGPLGAEHQRRREQAGRGQRGAVAVEQRQLAVGREGLDVVAQDPLLLIQRQAGRTAGPRRPR